MSRWIGRIVLVKPSGRRGVVWVKRRVVSILLAIATTVPGSWGWAADAAPHVVIYRNDRLSVRLEGVPLQDVLTELENATGAELRGSLQQPREITTEFDDVPMPEALHRLLGEQNFVLKYGEGGRLRAVKLLGIGAQVPATTASVPPVSSTPPAPSLATFVPGGGLAAVAAAFLGHPSIPVRGQLAEALGTNSATFRQLFIAGISENDPGLRAEATRTWLGAFEADPDLRANVLTSFLDIDDAALTRVLRRMAGRQAEELLTQIATQAQGADLRAKAASVLQQLRAGPRRRS